MLKRILFSVLLSLLISNIIFSQVKVRGYYRKDGTYVRPHTRTSPDGNPYNNYSFPGNYNPNTGEISKGNPDTYLKNYYKHSSYPSSSIETNNTSSGDNTYNYIKTTSPTNDYYKPIQNKVNIIKDNISRGNYEQISIDEIDKLISELLEIKAALNNKSKPSNKSDKIYYIIVYSETERSNAENKLNNCKHNYVLNKYDYKIYPAYVKGRQWFRVALGSFNSYREAKGKLQELAGSIPSDSWVIQY